MANSRFREAAVLSTLQLHADHSKNTRRQQQPMQVLLMLSITYGRWSGYGFFIYDTRGSIKYKYRKQSNLNHLKIIYKNV